jgi:hypothetical protein
MFVADYLAADRDLEQAATQKAVAPDYYEGAADFAFGYMPRYPNNPAYLEGWNDKLRGTVQMDGEIAIYPEGTYRVPATSDCNAALFSDVPHGGEEPF